ncbi:hypothetical protein D3C81_938630 [compost metagenome]
MLRNQIKRVLRDYPILLFALTESAFHLVAFRNILYYPEHSSDLACFIEFYVSLAEQNFILVSKPNNPKH